MSEERSTPRSRWFQGKLKIRLIGAAGGVLLALLIAPATRRLTLSQAQMTVPYPSALASMAGIQPRGLDNAAAPPAYHAVFERHPNDLQFCIAAAVSPGPDGQQIKSDQKITNLRALESRFSSSPALYANILRYCSQGEVLMHRREQDELSGQPLPPNVSYKVIQSDPKALEAFDQDATTGERLDPENAYFPLMHAISLYNQHRDAEAEAAVAGAARKPEWHEYYDEELNGQWRMQDEAFVNNSALLHTGVAAAILFPQYASIRAVARMEIYEAMEAEKAGHIEEGLAIRKAVMRLGSLMRLKSCSLIGTFVGIAIDEIAIARPDGAPPVLNNEKKMDAVRTERRRQFNSYLLRIGHTEIEPIIGAELAVGDQVKELLRTGMTENSPFDRPLVHLCQWWIADLLTLSNMLWLLLMGGLAALLLRNRRLAAGQPLPGYARAALPLGLVAGALATPALCASVSHLLEDIQIGDRFNMLLVGLPLALLLLVLPTKVRRDRLRRLGVFGAGMLAGLLLTTSFVWQVRGIEAIAELLQIFTSGFDNSQPQNIVSNLLWFTASVPVLILLTLAIISRVCRVPLSVGMARGLRGLAAPLAALMFLIYGGMMLGTVRAEARMEYGLNRMLGHEGEYLAGLTGKIWPTADVTRKLIEP